MFLGKLKVYMGRMKTGPLNMEDLNVKSHILKLPEANSVPYMMQIHEETF